MMMNMKLKYWQKDKDKKFNLRAQQDHHLTNLASDSNSIVRMMVKPKSIQLQETTMKNKTIYWLNQFKTILMAFKSAYKDKVRGSSKHSIRLLISKSISTSSEISMEYITIRIFEIILKFTATSY